VKRVSVIRAVLDEAKISDALTSDYWRVRVINQTTSTQDVLKTELVSNGDCVVTEFQSAGRGRLDRSFDSVANVALLFSFYVKPNRRTQLGWIPLISGMSVARTINEVTSSHDYLTKWPNDVITESGKVAGILCEYYGEGIIIGIGINVSTTPEELPVATASSIYITSGIEIDRNLLIALLLKNFQDLFTDWNNGRDFRGAYRALSKTIGTEVSVILPADQVIRGMAIDVGADGELLLESGDRISVGDVVHLR